MGSTFLQLLGYGDHGDIADIESAIFSGNVEIPKTGGFRFLLQAFHEFDIATNLGIAAQLRAAFPPAPSKMSGACKNSGSKGTSSSRTNSSTFFLVLDESPYSLRRDQYFWSSVQAPSPLYHELDMRIHTET